jgi:hypothetical protein
MFSRVPFCSQENVEAGGVVKPATDQNIVLMHVVLLLASDSYSRFLVGEKTYEGKTLYS